MNVGLMFVVAFFPNFVGSLGLPDVTTSYGYLINGLVGIYVGPALLKSLSGKLGRTACVVISLLLAGASVLILNIDLPLVIVLVSVCWDFSTVSALRRQATITSTCRRSERQG